MIIKTLWMSGGLKTKQNWKPSVYIPPQKHFAVSLQTTWLLHLPRTDCVTLPESWLVGQEVKSSLSSFHLTSRLEIFQKTWTRTLCHMGPIQFLLSSSSSFHASSQVWKSRPRMMTFVRGLAVTKAAVTIHHSLKEQNSFTSLVKSLTETMDI